MSAKSIKSFNRKKTLKGYKRGMLFTDDRCLCGHDLEDHFINAKSGKEWCGVEDTVNWLLHCECKDFRLDNLHHIEILAELKEQGYALP